ncbi:MAG: proline dehydrogenase family protein, partial [Vicinamibacterales bacterium]
MLAAASKAFFHALAGSQILKNAASRYGMRSPSSPGRRFVAGETLDDAIAAARRIEAKGLHHTLDYLGESVRNVNAAAAAADTYRHIIETIVNVGIERNVSVKLTQLGLDVDRATCVDNLRRMLDPARGTDCFVRIDMESSAYTAVTLDIFETLWHQGYTQLGVVLQSALRRSESDLDRINSLGARVRLVKGAYNEPKEVAYQKKADVDRAFVRLMDKLLREGRYPAIATHDVAIIDETKRRAARVGLGRDAFEFQMLFGIRRDLQTALASEGYRVRIYIPFGKEWFPYFMRRLGERPANLWFVIRGLIQETRV